MEETISPQGHNFKQHFQTAGRKAFQSGPKTDIWLVVREGSVADVDSALTLLKKNGGNINSRNTFGLTPLHIATWRNHLPIVKRLLAAGADPNARDGESGWSSLHRALHFGHLTVASILLQSGASPILEDSKSRTPVDLLSGPVLQVLENKDNLAATEVFSWGSGVNYQLGTGNAHIQKLPCKVDSLHGLSMKLISAAKFHSVAVSACGEVYTWGFGRGGRLGHPDFDIHSGQAAVITPRRVTLGLGARRIKAVAAAKHHTIVATEGGEVFTWGSNREGQLGYTSVDTQPTPRRVSSLKSKIITVAAANKHTAVVSECGEVFTWGCNKEGQLGYGTSNSASNYMPRAVESLKGKVFSKVATAKYHTIVLGADGEVYTWGHRLVTPRRVIVTQNIKKVGNTPMKFHRREKLHVSSIAAGMMHSMALTDDGALFYWVSSDPDLRCQQLYSICGRELVSVSAGKYWTAAATVRGDIYMWDGKKGKDEPPNLTRLHGVKRATTVSVGETHLLVIGSLYHPSYPHCNSPKLKINDKVDLEDLEEVLFNDIGSNMNLLAQKEDVGERPTPTLKSLCEKSAAMFLVEPRNAIQLLEIADSLGADDLKKLCEDMVIRNLDFIFTVSTNAISSASLDILAALERLLDSRSSEPWSYRRLPTPTAIFPVVINSEEDDSENEFLKPRDKHTSKMTSKDEKEQSLDSFLHPSSDANEAICRLIRSLRKKLQQIEMLEVKQSKGNLLDDQQIAKLQTRIALEYSLAELGVPVENTKASSSVSSEGKGNKKKDLRKQRRKSKQKTSQVAGEAMISEIVSEANEVNTVKGFLEVGISQVAKKEEGKLDEVFSSALEFCVSKDANIGLSKTSSLTAGSKKKNKKGGLSMFLSGALDDIPKKEILPLPPPMPKIEGPVWGGAKLSKASSIREILDEQSKCNGNQPASTKEQSTDDGRSGGKVPLSSFMPSNPISVVSPKTLLTSDGEKNTPPWGATSGTPPSLSRPSLKNIQMEQGKHLNHNQCVSHSPKTRTTGFAVTSQGSPSDSSCAGINRWFKPEMDAASPIRSIQIEEKAIKDFKRFYTSVKIVKRQA
ncbi:uncharacterized protein LOC124919203 isoform X2 [Impatiens glandulifera]|uniref:uncharacterized protein LOC124919203 isoform X2 n=1 Tax=Impatiens glandulifera TaxID=253017 RepID=UPI001FB12E6E|nr:uncharacterized protein LOC124919203 isoform X2 [Impatiens glandulifera]